MTEVSFTDLWKKLRLSSSSYQSKFLAQTWEINFDHRRNLHHIIWSKFLSHTCERNYDHHHNVHHILWSKFLSQSCERNFDHHHHINRSTPIIVIIIIFYNRSLFHKHVKETSNIIIIIFRKRSSTNCCLPDVLPPRCGCRNLCIRTRSLACYIQRHDSGGCSHSSRKRSNSHTACAAWSVATAIVTEWLSD